MFTVSP